MQKLACPRSGVWGLAFSPDGDMLAGAGRGALYCWTRSRGWEQTGLRHPNYHITGAAFHPSGRSLAYGLLPTGAASAGAFAGLRLYSLTAEPELEPEWLAVAPPATFAPALWVQGFAFTPDGRALVAHRQEQRTLFGPWAPVLLHWHFVPSGDGLRAQSPEPGQTDLPAGAALVRGCLVLAGKWGVCVCAPGAEAPAAVPSSARADDVATGGELVAAAEGQRVRVWSLREPNPVASWPLPYQQAGVALAFSPDGRTLAAGYAGRTVALFDPLAGENRAEYDFGVGPVHSLAFAPDGMTLAVAGRAGLVVVDAE